MTLFQQFIKQRKARYGLQTAFLIFGLVFGGTVATLAHDYIDVGHILSSDRDGHHDEEGHDDHDPSGPSMSLRNIDDHDEEGHG